MPELIPFHNSPAFFSKQSAASSIYQISVLLSVDQQILYGKFRNHSVITANASADFALKNRY